MPTIASKSFGRAIALFRMADVLVSVAGAQEIKSKTARVEAPKTALLSDAARSFALPKLLLI
jgi:hypothetical protein